MEKSKFSFAAVFSLIVLLAYSYISFLGLVYWQNGKVAVPVLIIAGQIVMVMGCIWSMCMAKATRWKRIGMIGQVVFGAAVLIAFLASAVPFTNFMRVAEKESTILQGIENTVMSAKEIDDDYKRYVDARIDNYRSKLRLVSTGKDIRPSEYDECMGGAAGDTDEQKIENLSSSLRNKLLPDSTSVIQQHRQEWLDNTKDMSVWNVMFPANIATIREEVNGWSNNYSMLSSVMYKGEEAQPYEYKQFDNQLESVTSFYTELHLPTILAVVLAIAGFLIMLLPYFMTESDLAGAKSNQEAKMYE